MNVIFVLSSVTYALKSQELLKKENIYSSLIRSPAVKAVKGCGYGIMLNAEHETGVRNILHDAGINILGTLYD
jgi:hypothetical protein